MDPEPNDQRLRPIWGTYGIDSGRSLTKIIYFSPPSAPELPDYVVVDTSVPSILPGVNPDPCLDWNGALPEMKFIKIPKLKTADFIKFAAETKFRSEEIIITGGGGYTYADLIQQQFNIPVVFLDEYEMIVKGLNYLLKYNPNEVFQVHPQTKEQSFGALNPLLESGKSYFPYLLVNVGAGVSILKITGPGEFERVTGSSVGGGTFYGLCRLLTSVRSYAEVVQLSKGGDNKNVDLLVGDIYGNDTERYSRLGLKADLIASSFGKVATRTFENEPRNREFSDADKIRSLLFMISNNICQIAYLNAKILGIERVFFAGGFIQGNEYLWSRFAFGIDFWSGGTIKALFLSHDGYLGALGAFLHGSSAVKSDNTPGAP